MVWKIWQYISVSKQKKITEDPTKYTKQQELKTAHSHLVKQLSS